MKNMYHLINKKILHSNFGHRKNKIYGKQCLVVKMILTVIFTMNVS